MRCSGGERILEGAILPQKDGPVLGETLYVEIQASENRSKKHGRIHSRYNLEAKLGNVKEQHRKAFNRLTELRASARYLMDPLVIDVKQADLLFSGVQDAITFAEKRVAIEKV